MYFSDYCTVNQLNNEKYTLQISLVSFVNIGPFGKAQYERLSPCPEAAICKVPVRGFQPPSLCTLSN